MKVYSVEKIIKNKNMGILIPKLLTLKHALKLIDNTAITVRESIVIPGDLLTSEILKLGEKVYNLQENNKDSEAISLIKEWINNNYYPYNPKRIISYGENESYQSFVRDISNVYLIFSSASLLKKIISGKRISNIKEKLKLLKLYLDKLNFESLIGDQNYLNHIEYSEFKIDELLIAYQTLDTYINNSEDDLSQKEKLDKLCHAFYNILINYTYNSFCNNPDYLVTIDYPLLLKQKELPKYYTFRKTECLMGIIYYELFNFVIAKNNNINLKFCEYEKCNTLFIPSGNQKYCDICIANGIPKKVRDQKYNNSEKGKEYHREYYQKNHKKKNKK